MVTVSVVYQSGGGHTIFKAFLEKAFDPWMEQRWKDKIAGGFTNSSSQNGDELCSLFQLVIFRTSGKECCVNDYGCNTR